MKLNRKQQKTFDSVFAVPTPANIKFADIEKLITSLGGIIIEGSGSRISFELNGRRVFLHRPHPGKDAKKYQVEAVREILLLTETSDE